MDLEYIALRRRMSRVRVQLGKQPIGSDSEQDAGDTDMYADLIKFWKKRGTSFAPELITESRKQRKRVQVTKQRGRRKSIEFEDLQMQTSGGKLKLSLPGNFGQQGTEARKVATFPSHPEWVGKPEAIASVRRPRKTIPDQQRNFVMHRSSTQKMMGKKEKQIVTDKLSGIFSNPKKKIVGRTVSDSVLRKSNGLLRDSKLTPSDKSPDLPRKASDKNSPSLQKSKDKNSTIVEKDGKK